MNRTNASNPYVGLRSFDVDESILFFGRNDQALELLQRLHEHHFVAVVGSSGSGKSSLLRAGLIPSLKAGYLVENSDHWCICIMKPGQSPLYNLVATLHQQAKPAAVPEETAAFVQQVREEGASALLELLIPLWKKQNINFFLLVDQFEELFRFAMEQQHDVDKKDDAIDFVNIMIELSRQILVPFYVVITMRSDFIGDCAQFNGLPEAMNKSQYLVPRLNRMQMKTAIEGPAKLYGGKINPALISRLLNDCNRIKDELPLLQHALMRTWDQEMDKDKNGELDLKDYESTGGIEKALSNHADEALAGMNEEDLAITKKIFQALTAIDVYGRKIRRPVLLSELKAITSTSEKKLLDIINLFIEDKRSFLVIYKDGGTTDRIIDISHESLIRQWDTLNKWVEEEGGSTSNYLQLNESAELYRQHKKDLITGSELQLALEWYYTFKPLPSWANRYKNGFEETVSYLKMSENDRNLKQMDLKEKKRKQRNLIYLVIFILAGLSITAGIAALKFEKLKKIAEAHYLYAESRQALSNDPNLALALVVESLKKNFDPAADQLKINIYREQSFYNDIVIQEEEFTAVAFSPDRKTICTGSANSMIRLWDLEGNKLQEFKVNSGIVNALAFSPDGKTICAGSDYKTASLWDIKGNRLQVFSGQAKSISAVAFSPDGKTILTGSTDGSTILRDLKGDTLHVFRFNHSGKQSGYSGISCVAFSPNGKNIITGSLDSTARLWDLQGGFIKEFRHFAMVNTVAFSPDGQFILTGCADKAVRLWGTEGNRMQIFTGLENAVTVAEFSPDGKSILAGCDDKTIIIYDLRGTVLHKFQCDSAYIKALLFSPDRKTIISISSRPKNNTIRLWTLKGIEQQEFIDHKASVRSVAFSADGNFILTGSSDSTACLWEQSGKLIRHFKGHSDAVTSVAFSPSGKFILTGSADNSAILWDLEGNKVQIFNGHTGAVNAIAFSENGERICTGSDDHTARIWDLKGNLLQEFKGHMLPVKSIAFSPDGTTILTGSSDKTARLWDMKGSNITEFRQHTKLVYAVAFSPDGKTVLTGSGDNSAILWDLKGNIIQNFTGHSSPVTSVAFSSDGTTIATGTKDMVTRLWDHNGNVIEVFKGHTDAVNAVAFSPDGKFLLTGSEDNSARLWKVAVPVNDFLKSKEFKGLTPRQKKDYGIE